MALKGYNTGYLKALTFHVLAQARTVRMIRIQQHQQSDTTDDILAPHEYSNPPVHLHPRISTPKPTPDAYADVDSDECGNRVAGCSPTTPPRPRSFGYKTATPERAAAGYKDLVIV